MLARLRALFRGTRIADTSSGARVAIRGVARKRDALLAAPVTGESCVAYRLHVQRHDGGGGNERWADVLTMDSEADFYLEQEEQRALVPGKYCEIEPRWPGEWRRGATPKALHAILRRAGRGVRQTIRWRELCIHEGQRIEVNGVADWRAEDDERDSSYRERPKRLHLDAPDTGWVRVRRLQ